MGEASYLLPNVCNAPPFLSNMYFGPPINHYPVLTVNGLIFVGYQFSWFSWRVLSTNSSTNKRIATNFDPNEFAIFVQSTRIGNHENKAIHNISLINANSGMFGNFITFFTFLFISCTLTPNFYKRVPVDNYRTYFKLLLVVCLNTKNGVCILHHAFSKSCKA